MLTVIKKDKEIRGVFPRTERLPFDVAARRLVHAGFAPTPATAKIALLTGEPIETTFCVYQLQ